MKSIVPMLVLGCILSNHILSDYVTAADKPNIILLFADDLTTQAISAYQHPLKLLQTPGMDRLANEGMRFDRAVVPNSICGPSRAVILTGKYSHLNGFVRNGNSWLPNRCDRQMALGK
jgi:arylsulfatase A-like enzyme